MSSFKPGDWIILSNSSDGRSLAQVKETYLGSNKAKLYWPSENSTAVCSEMQYYELWQPKVGEWCWFWNQSDINLSISPHIGQYGNLSYSLEFYDNCEPFIGQLPTFIKDQS